jgi:hypothetical protein
MDFWFGAGVCVKRSTAFSQPGKQGAAVLKKRLQDVIFSGHFDPEAGVVSRLFLVACHFSVWQ